MSTTETRARRESRSAREQDQVLYDDTPTWAKMTGWLLLGIGGLVLIPVGLANHAWWIWFPATPLIVAGLLLLANHLHITVEHRTGVIHATNTLLGTRMRERRYAPSDVVGLDVHRVAGAKRERASDTYYLQLRLRTTTHVIGRYDSRPSAMEARRQMRQVIRVRPIEQSATEMRASAEEKVRSQPESAMGYYQLGLAAVRAADAEGAQEAFRKALELTREPLLRHMIEQRLADLDKT